MRSGVTRVKVVGRCLYKKLDSDHEIGSSRNQLSTFLYFRLQYHYSFSLYIHSSSTRAYALKIMETIVIVLATGCPR